MAVITARNVVFIRENDSREKSFLLEKRLGGDMKIVILLILLVPILLWIALIATIFENAAERMKNYNTLEALVSLGFGILMAYGLYEFLLKIIDPG